MKSCLDMYNAGSAHVVIDRLVDEVVALRSVLEQFKDFSPGVTRIGVPVFPAHDAITASNKRLGIENEGGTHDPT